MNRYQQTVEKTVHCEGVGVHSGKSVHLTIKPASVNQGIQFVRADLPNKPAIRAHFNNVIDTSLATVIGADGVIVSTIEHIMASFSALSIDNATVELDHYEMPIMDGSAGPFAELIKSAGIQKQVGPRCFFVIKEPIELEEKGKFVGAYPLPGFKITCSIDYPHPLIQSQSYTYEVSRDTFEEDISRARTFGFLAEYEHLKRYGLARGGSLDNAIVIGEDHILNEDGLRYSDEFVRHKILDCIGDFSLMGMPIMGHLKVSKSGHEFNHAFLQKFFSKKSSWETCTLNGDTPA